MNTIHTSAEDMISGVIRESIEVKRAMLDQQLATIVQIAQVLIDALRAGRKLLVFGNGGSAADAQHVAGELVSRFLLEREALAAIALTTDTSIMTAISNDTAFDQVFARQVQALAQPGDIVAGISTSGQSASVLNGVIAARHVDAITIGFTGQTGGQLRDMVDYCFCAPSHHTPRIQEAHIVAWHAICEVVEREMAGSVRGPSSEM